MGFLTKLIIPYVFRQHLDGSVDDIEWKYNHAMKRRHGSIDDLRVGDIVFTNELIYRLVENRIQNYDLPPFN